MRSVELNLKNNEGTVLQLPGCAHVISESMSALARAAPESSALRLRARLHADHCCMMEGSCAINLSFLRHKSARMR